ncbi:hypothetical protein B0H17DRAFT_1208328 [Mycena rosella]|uniref:Uncharacterized protein n=1 Tax=Mycena rosella TaxID=1033263 RepID=A0AAD7G9N1_MYCRO|nr:hypothetical protein B0H17DRAFT_1208328 [Mycena rosella]
MAPKLWTTSKQLLWLESHVAAYLDSKVTGDQIEFFTTLDENWFQLREWFRNHTQKTRGSGTKPTKKDDMQSLAAALWKDNKRHCDPQLIELWHTMYPEKGKAALEAAGYYTKHAGDLNWVGEKGTEAEAGVRQTMKEQASARMKLWRKVTIATFAQESEEVKNKLEAELKRVQADKLAGKGKESAVRTPQSAQLSLDQLEGVIKRVHKLIEEKTGWVGFSLFGGPTPNDNGNLNFVLLSSGLTPAGNNFPKSHPNWEQDALPDLDELLSMPKESESGSEMEDAPAKSKSKKPLPAAPKRKGKNFSSNEAAAADNADFSLSFTAAPDPRAFLARAASPLEEDGGWDGLLLPGKKWLGPEGDASANVSGAYISGDTLGEFNAAPNIADDLQLEDLWSGGGDSSAPQYGGDWHGRTDSDLGSASAWSNSVSSCRWGLCRKKFVDAKLVLFAVDNTFARACPPAPTSDFVAEIWRIGVLLVLTLLIDTPLFCTLLVHVLYTLLVQPLLVHTSLFFVHLLYALLVRALCTRACACALCTHGCVLRVLASRTFRVPASPCALHVYASRTCRVPARVSLIICVDRLLEAS